MRSNRDVIAGSGAGDGYVSGTGSPNSMPCKYNRYLNRACDWQIEFMPC